MLMLMLNAHKKNATSKSGKLIIAATLKLTILIKKKFSISFGICEPLLRKVLQI